MMFRGTNVARHEYRLPVGHRQERPGLGGIFVPAQIGDQNIRALTCIGDGDRPANVAVRAGNHGLLAEQPVASTMELFRSVRALAASSVRPGIGCD
jgi:hypothetical protein